MADQAPRVLYIFEFVVDDLLITRPNPCAPEEYPTCCELTFRDNVYAAVCDRQPGNCVDMADPKQGKCVVFSLDKPVSDEDTMMVHVYKRNMDSCKFLLGTTEFPVKEYFDKVDEKFEKENENWREIIEKTLERLPDPRNPGKTKDMDDGCDDDDEGRPEQLCPATHIVKLLLPLFNMKKKQTGNIVILLRLVCSGPAIVTSFPAEEIESEAPKKSKTKYGNCQNHLCD